MFDNIGRVAEQVATSVSRRGFLGIVGRWAAATAVGVAGLLTTTSTARAGTKLTCCYYGPPGFQVCPRYYKCVKGLNPSACPATCGGFGLQPVFASATICSKCPELNPGGPPLNCAETSPCPF